MGEEFPAELQSALDQMNIMQLLTADSFFAPGLFGDFFSDVDPEQCLCRCSQYDGHGRSGANHDAAGTDAVSEAAPSFAAEGSNAAAGFAGALAAGQGAAAAAARQLVQAALNAAPAGSGQSQPQSGIRQAGPLCHPGIYRRDGRPGGLRCRVRPHRRRCGGRAGGSGQPQPQQKIPGSSL